MKLADLEALVKQQGEQLAQVRAWSVEALENTRYLGNELKKLSEWMGADESDGPFHEEFKNVLKAVEELEGLVKGRNKSAAVKRNMTDPDAIRVLQGDLSTMGHKEAAEVIGLTYAQVYSCRLGFTFKHVHRDLERAGWTSKWAKG